VAVVAALLLSTPATPARADDQPVGTGSLRIAHLSPDTPAVDATVGPPGPTGGGTPVPGLAYGDVTGYAEVPAGRYAVSIRAAGQGAAGPPVLSTLVEVLPGGARTVAVTGRFADLALTVLADDHSAPPPGSARLRALAAAGAAGPLDITLTGGPPLATALAFPGAGDWTTVPAGAATLRVRDGATSADLPISPAAGSVSTVLVLDRPGGGLSVRLVPDAAGPAVAPAGAVDAGGGRPGGAAGPLSALLLAGAAGVAAGARGRTLVLGGVLVLAATAAPPVPEPVAPPSLAIAAAPVRAPAAATAEVALPPPQRLRIPAAGVDAPVVAVRLAADRSLAAPDTAGAVGWLRSGPVPGARGPAVLAGHVDSAAGASVFFRLDEVAAGDEVLVEGADGTTRFTVTRVERHPKSAFPAAAVYAPTTGAELRLITCGGTFDRAAGSYTDNVVVFAHAAG
jgi:sortase (surface protein transpeptidase)